MTRVVSPRVGVPFLLALLGVVFMLGLVVEQLLGAVGVAVYVLLLLAPLGYAMVKARQRRSRLAAGRTCTCCTGSVHDPVQVI
jgi:hypothetical protein